MRLIIRPYANEDRAAMTALYRRAWHDTYDAVDGAAAIDRVIVALLEGEPPEMFSLPPGDVALVTEFGRRLIGGIRGHPRPSGVHLSGMYVAPDAQRCSAGSAMLATLLGRFPPDTVVRADVRPTSLAARQFYARHGFVEIGRSRADVGGNHWVDVIELRRGVAQA